MEQLVIPEPVFRQVSGFIYKDIYANNLANNAAPCTYPLDIVHVVVADRKEG